MKELVKVEWFDSYGVTSKWTAVVDIIPVELICISVGYIIYEDENKIALAPHYAHETTETLEQCSGVMTIPKCSIANITTLIEKA
jgi:hypothetical protein